MARWQMSGRHIHFT